MAAAYRSLQVYHATISAESHLDQGAWSGRYRGQADFAFGRPNRFRLESSSPSTKDLLISDGTTLTTYEPRYDQYIQHRAPEKLTVKDMERWVQLTPGLVVPQLLASDDPLAELLRGVEKVKEIGTENLDGIPVILVELTKSVLTLGPTLPAGTGDFPVTARLWIGAQDHLIHQVSYSPVEANIKGEEATVRHTNIEVTPAHPKAFFTFALPAGAHLVKQFALPYDVELAKEHHAAE